MAAPAAAPTGKLGDAIELAWKQQRDADASGPAMGLGWMIAGDGQTRWHNGQTGGSRSALFINRELNCTVVVLCNTAVTDAVGQPSLKRPFSLLVTTGCHVRPKSLLPSVNKLSQEIKGRLVSLATGSFTTPSDAERANYPGRNRAIYRFSLTFDDAFQAGESHWNKKLE
jgi:CubicO group peptidase (beta-lactamase class C family)